MSEPGGKSSVVSMGVGEAFQCPHRLFPVCLFARQVSQLDEESRQPGILSQYLHGPAETCRAGYADVAEPPFMVPVPLGDALRQRFGSSQVGVFMERGVGVQQS